MFIFSGTTGCWSTFLVQRGGGQLFWYNRVAVNFSGTTGWRSTFLVPRGIDTNYSGTMGFLYQYSLVQPGISTEIFWYHEVEVLCVWYHGVCVRIIFLGTMGFVSGTMGVLYFVPDGTTLFVLTRVFRRKKIRGQIPLRRHALFLTRIPRFFSGEPRCRHPSYFVTVCNG